MNNPAVFRAYDIRGVADQDFDEAWVEDLGRACAVMFLQAGRRRVALGRDCRVSSPGCCRALERGLLSSGLDVIRLGMVPSPCVYFAAAHLDLQAGIMVTASHNPPEYNGFKILLGDTTVYEDGIQNLRRIMESGNFVSGRGVVSDFDIGPAYVKEIVTRLGSCKPFKVVLDCGNGAAGPLGARVLSELGARVVRLFCEPDGAFPHHHPDPSRAENMLDLREAMRKEEADIGIGLDGDGDRIGVMDRTGRLLYGDELLAVYARDLLTRHPGAAILADVKCSRRLFDDIEARGGAAEMCRTGHSIVKALMREKGSLLAGELSGHMFHAENWFGFDDAIYSAARLLVILSRQNLPLETLPGWPQAWSTPEISHPCPDACKNQIVRQIRDWYRGRRPLSEIDGARVLFPHGWGLVRASNTSPSLVLRFEADSEEHLRLISEEMRDKIRQFTEQIRQSG